MEALAEAQVGGMGQNGLVGPKGAIATLLLSSQPSNSSRASAGAADSRLAPPDSTTRVSYTLTADITIVSACTIAVVKRRPSGSPRMAITADVSTTTGQ